MYTLLSGFYHYYTLVPQYSLLLLGLDNAGKTTFLEQMKRLYGEGSSAPRLNHNNVPVPSPSLIPSPPPTVGLNLCRIIYPRPKSRLLLWDLGGQEGLRVLWDKYFSDAHCILYLIDLMDTERYGDAQQSIKSLLADKDLVDCPLLILGNKMDREEVKDINIEEFKQKILNIDEINVYGRIVEFYLISALKGEGVRKAADWIMNIIPTGRRTKLLAEKE